jgi:hypothetical protein
LVGGSKNLLVFEGASPDAVGASLAGDPWLADTMLPIAAVFTWEILLGNEDLGAAAREAPRYFLATSVQSDAWVSGVDMREQQRWSDHAAFMNGPTAVS